MHRSTCAKLNETILHHVCNGNQQRLSRSGGNQLPGDDGGPTTSTQQASTTVIEYNNYIMMILPQGFEAPFSSSHDSWTSGGALQCSSDETEFKRAGQHSWAPLSPDWRDCNRS